MWERARRKSYDAADPLRPCRGCPIGARNAGQGEVSADGDTLAMSQSQVCLRCGRSDGWRLLANAICISCWNRGREALLGKNARGGKPKYCPPIFGFSLMCKSGNDETAEIWGADIVEVMGTILRKRGDVKEFAWPPLRAPFKREWSGISPRPLQNNPSFRVLGSPHPFEE